MSRGIYRLTPSRRPARWIPTAPAVAPGAYTLTADPGVYAITGSASTPCFSSTFAGSESPLSEGGVWTVGGPSSMKKVAGFATPVTASNFGWAGYTGHTWAADQSSTVTRGGVGAGGYTDVAACVRMSGFPDPNGYVLYAQTADNYRLYTVTGGDFDPTPLQTWAVVPTATDVIKLTVVGNTLTPEINGVPLTPFVDSGATYTTGAPGFHVYTDGNDTAVASWEGCALGAPTAGAYTLTANPGAYAVTGSSAALTSSGAVAFDPVMTPTGMTNAVAFWAKEARVQFFNAGVFPVVVTPGAFTLSANPGAYSITGSDASPLAGRRVAADPGVYAVTGSVANLTTLRVFTLTADPGSYAVTGSAAGVLAARTLIADSGLYVLTGSPATLVKTSVGAYVLVANSGVYTLTGSDATFRLANRVMQAAPGTYTITGADATLLPSSVVLTFIYLDVAEFRAEPRVIILPADIVVLEARAEPGVIRLIAEEVIIGG